MDDLDPHALRPGRHYHRPGFHNLCTTRKEPPADYDKHDHKKGGSGGSKDRLTMLACIFTLAVSLLFMLFGCDPDDNTRPVRGYPDSLPQPRQQAR